MRRQLVRYLGGERVTWSSGEGYRFFSANCTVTTSAEPGEDVHLRVEEIVNNSAYAPGPGSVLDADPRELRLGHTKIHGGRTGSGDKSVQAGLNNGDAARISAARQFRARVEFA